MSEARTWSYSSASTIAQCGMQWWLQKVARAPQRPAAWFSHGTSVHSAIEHYERSERRSRKSAIEVFHTEYDRLIAEAQETEPDDTKWLRGGRVTTARDIDNRRDTGATQVEWYMDFADISGFKIWRTPEGEPALELRFEREWGGVPVIGYIDAVWEWPDGSIEPVDLKTGARPEAARQLGVYRVALEETYGLTITHGRYVLLKTGIADPVELTWYTRRRMDVMFSAAQAAVDNRMFDSHVGKHCFTCTVKDHCGEYQIF